MTVSKDPISLMQDVINGIDNNVEQIRISIQQKTQELAGFETMRKEYVDALEAFKMFGIKKRMGTYPGLDRIQANDGTNQDTSA